MSPDQIPSPWLFDDAAILSELDRIRSLVLAVPVSQQNYAPLQSVLDAVWNFAQTIRFMSQLRSAGQKSWSQSDPDKALPQAPAPRASRGASGTRSNS